MLCDVKYFFSGGADGDFNATATADDQLIMPNATAGDILYRKMIENKEMSIVIFYRCQYIHAHDLDFRLIDEINILILIFVKKMK